MDKPIPARPALAKLLQHYVERHGYPRSEAEKLFSHVMKRTVEDRRYWPAGLTPREIREGMGHAASVYTRSGMDGVYRLACLGMRLLPVRLETRSVRLEPDSYVLLRLLYHLDRGRLLHVLVLLGALHELGRLGTSGRRGSGH